MAGFDKVIGHCQQFSFKNLTGLFLSADYMAPSVFAAGFLFHNLYRMIIMLRWNKLEENIGADNGVHLKYEFGYLQIRNNGLE